MAKESTVDTAWHSNAFLQLQEHVAKGAMVDEATISVLGDYWGKSEADQANVSFLPAQAGGAGRATYTDDDDDVEVLRPNVIYPHIASMVAAIVPSVPRVSLEPEVYPDDPAEAEAMAAASQAREARIHKVFRTEKFPKKLRRAAALAALTGYAAGRVIWHPGRKRIEIDVVPRTRFWFDTTADRWEDVRYVVWTSVLLSTEFAKIAQAMKEKAEKNPDIWVCNDIDGIINSAPQDSMPTNMDDNRFGGGSAITNTNPFVVRYDYYDYTRKRWLVFIRGKNTPVMDGPLPYKFVENNFFIVTLVDNLVTLTGLPDTQVIEQAVAAKGEVDTLALLQLRANIPHMFINKNIVKNADAITAALQGARGPSAFVLDMPANVKFDDAIKWSKGPSVMFETAGMSDRWSGEIQRLTATPDVSRGMIGGAQVATEVAVADALRREQQTPRVDEVMDVISDVARIIMRIDAQFFPVNGSMMIRPDDQSAPVRVSRESMRMPTPKKVEKGEEATWGDLQWQDEFDVAPVPYAGSETHALANGNAIISRHPFLANNPYVDQRILTAAIVAGTARPDMLLTEEQMKAKAMEAASMQSGAAPPEGDDPLAALAGALPPQILDPRAEGQDGVSTGALAAGDEPKGLGGLTGGAGFPAPKPGVPGP